MSEQSAEGNTSPQGQSAPAGWYPDPAGSGNLFYWDGSKWTGDVRAAESRTTRNRRAISMPRGLVIGGGAALAISPFLTWVKVVLLGDLTLFQLFDAAGRSRRWAWGAVAAGGTAAYVGYQERSIAVRFITAIAVGVIGGVYAVIALTGLRHDIQEAHGLAAVGIGPYVAIGGCIALVVGAVMVMPRRSRPPDK